MSFDHLADVYEPLERLCMGRTLHRCRTAFLREAGGARRVLILGEGDGRFLEDFLRSNLEARVDCVERSPAMVDRTMRRLGRTGSDGLERVRFWREDARSWHPPRLEYDLIVTNFFLDCFEPGEVAGLVAKIRDRAGPGAVWLVGEFRVPPAGPARWRAFLWVWLLYRVFRATTAITARRLPEHRPMLVEAGFALQAESQTEGGMLVSELWTQRSRSHLSKQKV